MRYESSQPVTTRQLWRGQLVRFAPYVASSVIFMMLPPLLPTYLESLMTKVLILSIFAMSYDFIYGYTGLLSLGHGAYFGVGGYVTGILILRYGIESFWISAPFGILGAALIAAVFGFIALRASGVYFMIITFALGQLLVSIATKWVPMTGGTDGLFGIPRPDLGLPWFTWDAVSFYYFVLLAFAVCFFLLYRIVHSPFGYALQGISQNEARMRSLGYNTWLYKYIAFIIGGLFAGVSGILLAHFNGIMVPGHLGFLTSFLVVLIVILGAKRTLFGSIIGAIVVVFVEYFASMFTPERWPLILGAVFILTVMYLRGGIAIHLLRVWHKVH